MTKVEVVGLDWNVPYSAVVRPTFRSRYGSSRLDTKDTVSRRQGKGERLAAQPGRLQYRRDGDGSWSMAAVADDMSSANTLSML